MKIKSYLIAFVFGLLLSCAVAVNLRSRESMALSTGDPTQQPITITAHYGSPTPTNPTGSAPQVISSAALSPDASVTSATATPSPSVDPLTTSPPPADPVAAGTTPPPTTPANNADEASDASDASDASNATNATNTTNTTNQTGNPFVYDFFNPPKNATVSVGLDGYQVIADNISFPFIGWTQLSMGVEVVGPCGLDPPHLHPTADEIALVISGAIYSGFVIQNSFPIEINELLPGMATLFERGAIHWLANLGCEPAYYVSAFDSSIPNVLDVAQNFFMFPDDIVSPALGYLDPPVIDDIRAHVPQNFTLGLEECLARCSSA